MRLLNFYILSRSAAFRLLNVDHVYLCMIEFVHWSRTLYFLSISSAFMHVTEVASFKYALYFVGQHMYHGQLLVHLYRYISSLLCIYTYFCYIILRKQLSMFSVCLLIVYSLHFLLLPSWVSVSFSIPNL
jgi:hypothetical protein